MNLSLSRIRSIFPHFNERPITVEDFWRVAKREKIVVQTMPLIVDGYFTQRRGRNYILINENLSPTRWLHTALHELHHYLFDAPGENENFTFYRDTKQKHRREHRADAFALIAILPMSRLLEIAAEEIEPTGELMDLVRDRIVVRTIFGV